MGLQSSRSGQGGCLEGTTEALVSFLMTPMIALKLMPPESRVTPDAPKAGDPRVFVRLGGAPVFPLVGLKQHLLGSIEVRFKKKGNLADPALISEVHGALGI